MRRTLSLSIVSMLGLFALSGTTFAAEPDLNGYSYMSMPGTGKFYTKPPKVIKLGMMGGNEKKRNQVFSALNVLSIIGDSSIEPSEGRKDDFVGVIFADNLLTQRGIDFSKIPNLAPDIESIEILKRSYQPGNSCTSSALYSPEGTFLRAIILSNADTDDRKLLNCTIEVAAHIFGINSIAADSELSIDRRFARVGTMIRARTECIQANDHTFECAFAKLQK